MPPRLAARSDFFPVVITFLRQLPFIGTFLSLPYIAGVSPLCPRASFILSAHLAFLPLTGRRPGRRVAHVRRLASA